MGAFNVEPRTGGLICIWQLESLSNGGVRACPCGESPGSTCCHQCQDSTKPSMA